jgi:hypothetical protein
MSDKCQWLIIEDNIYNHGFKCYDRYKKTKTTCENIIYNNKILLHMKKFHYCPYCGKEIEEIKNE